MYVRTKEVLWVFQKLELQSIFPHISVESSRNYFKLEAYGDAQYIGLEYFHSWMVKWAAFIHV